MTAVEGHRCDQCDAVELITQSYGRMQAPPAKRGWYVTEAIGSDTSAASSFWFCSAQCVVAYMRPHVGSR